MKRTKQIATHDNPVWRSKANFLIAADLSENGLEGASEQLWARREADNEFIICCIPFFTYGISLGDHVATFMDESRKYVVSHVIHAGGRRVIRIWLKGLRSEVRAEVIDFLMKHSLLYEWSSANLLAVDIPNAPGTFKHIADFLNGFSAGEKAIFEVG